MNPPNLENTNPQQNNNNNNSNNNNPYNNPNFGQGFQPVPNSVGVLVLGILSIVFCWCYGILAVIMGIIALVLAGQAERAYMENPQMYTLSSYKNMRAGKICAIIGLSLGSLYMIIIIVAVIINGAAAFGTFRGF